MMRFMATAVLAASLAAAAPGVTWPCLAQPATEPGIALSPELAELDARIAAIRDLRAGFEQRKHTPLLKKPLLSRGTVSARQDRVRWDTQSPRRSSLVAAGDEIRIYYPDERVVEIYPAAGDLRQLAGSPLPRLRALTEHFDIRSIEPSDVGEGALPERPLALELRPRTPELKDAVASVRVLLDAAVPCVTRLVMTDPDGERTEIEFRSVRANTGVADSEFELELPERTREVYPIGRRPPERPR